MRRVLWLAAVAAVTASGCTGTPDAQEPTTSVSSPEIDTPERIEGDGLCDDLLAEPMQSLADSYGFSVAVDEATGPRCHGFLEFAENDGPAVGVNGMSIAASADRFKTETEAEAAFAAGTDPESTDFRLTLASGRTSPERAELPAWDGFAIAVADGDAPNQELRALLLRGDTIVDLWVEVDPVRPGTASCALEDEAVPCAMTLTLAEHWTRTTYADALSHVVAGLNG